MKDTFVAISHFFQNNAAWIVLVILLVYTAYLHGNNMFQYPYYESDEGTYTSQAWSVITEGTLAPYTYWYDHPPVGWLTIATWYSLLPDSYFTFGNSIDTGRVLMLIFFLINTTIVYTIVRSVTKSTLYAALAVVLYVSSPLIIYFSRRVLLDNVQMLWLLLAVVPLLPRTLSLRNFALSGAFFGLAFLTKITAVMFGIPFMYLVIALKDKTHKLFRSFTWLCASGLVVSSYFVFAAIKSELFPPLDPSVQRVSFIGSLQFQLSRGGEKIPFYSQGSEFLNATIVWLQRDPLLVFLSLGMLIVSVLSFYFIKNVWFRFTLLANLFFLIFLIRGGLVIDFYFMPMSAFLAMLFGFLIWQLGVLIQTKYKGALAKRVSFAIGASLLVFLAGYYNFFVEQTYFLLDETKNQKAATQWIKHTLPETSDVLIDATMYVELHDSNYINDKVFTNAEWFYKVSRDPEIRIEKYDNNWQRFDYIALTHEMLKQISNFPDDDIVTQTFDNSLPVKKWFDGSTSFIDEQKRISTNGDWAMVYDVSSQSGVQLEQAWDYYKEHFIHSYGQVIDPSGNVTTSEGQSYAMLRAAWMNDHDTFKGVWLWTQHHLQHRLEDNLISWKWVDDELVDSANATDADIDIALALLFGYRTFGEESYLEDAKILINDIWEESVVDVNGVYHLVSSNVSHSQVPTGVLFNPSYLSPAHFRLFAEVDQAEGHEWNKLADDTYVIINKLKQSYQTPLIKNWYIVNPGTGNYSSANAHLGETADQFSYDAFRIFWRLWLDYAWFNNKSAENYLNLTGSYLSRIVGDDEPPTIIDPVTGKILSYRTTLAISSSYIFPLSFVDDSSVATNYYQRIVENVYNPDGFWAYETVYYDQNWAWFNAALYNHDVSNIWEFYRDGENPQR